MTPDAADRRSSSKANLRGRGGACFPMGRKASFIDRTRARSRSTSSSTPTSRSRARSRTARSWLRVPHRLIEGCLIAAHAIESKNVFIYIRGEYLTEYEILAAAVEEAREAKLLGGVEIIVHRGAGAYICGEETAPARVARGQARPAALEAAVPADPGLYASPTQINNVCTIATVPKMLEHRRRGVREDRACRARPGTRDLLRLGQRRAARQLRARRSGRRCATLIYDHARRHRRRPRAEGRHPGRLVGAGADARPDRHAARLRLARRDRDVLRLRRRSSSWTTAAAWCSSPSARRSSTCTSRAASARRAASGRAGWCRSSSRSRTGPRRSADLDLLDSTSATRSSASVLCALGEFAVDAGRELPREVARRVRRARRPAAAARSAASRRSRGSSRRPTSTRTHRRLRRCWFEHRARPGHDRRARRARPEGDRHRRDGARGRRRDPRLLLRAAPRRAGRRLPHVPRRGRGDAEAPDRLHAHRAGRDGREDGAHVGEGGRRARTRRSSSSSSTIRSTAPSATRAASARCRT